MCMYMCAYIYIYTYIYTYSCVHLSAEEEPHRRKLA